MGALGSHSCTFQPRVDIAISVLVNVTQPHPLSTLSYFKEPFWLHQAGESHCHYGSCHCHAWLMGDTATYAPFHGSDTSPYPTVLTEAPQIVQATVSQGQLNLQWLPPLEVLAEQLDYQVRYAVENSHDWKVRHGQGSPRQPCPPLLLAHGLHGIGQDGPTPQCFPFATPQQLLSPAQLCPTGPAGPAGSQERSPGPTARWPVPCPGAGPAQRAMVPGQLERLVQACCG